MFDFGFWEMIMILVIALIVVGPERLPGLARTAGLWVGKAKRFVTDVKSEIDLELANDALKKTLGKQGALQDVYEIIEETKQVGQKLKQDFTQIDTDSDTSNNAESGDSNQLQAPIDPHTSPGNNDKS